MKLAMTEGTGVKWLLLGMSSNVTNVGDESAQHLGTNHSSSYVPRGSTYPPTCDRVSTLLERGEWSVQIFFVRLVREE